MDLLSGDTGKHFAVAIFVVGLALAAFAAVLWFLRNRPVAPLLTRSSKERQKRLTVVDAAMIDARRRAVLIRRDGVEHLILIGGPADIVIESNIAPPGSAPELETPRQQLAEPAVPHSRPQERPVQQREIRPAPAPAPAPRPQVAMPSEDNEYTYGPGAALSARDFTPEPSKYEERSYPTPPVDEPANIAPPPTYAELTRQAQASLQQKRKTAPERPTGQESLATPEAPALPEINADNAEEIIAMLRARILGDNHQAAPAPLPAAVAPTEAPAAAAPAERPRNETPQSAFSRVLDGNPEPGDLPREQTPTVKPARSWSPDVTSTPPSAAATAPPPAPVRQPPSAAETREKLRQEQMLQLEMARILQEMQTRRSK